MKVYSVDERDSVEEMAASGFRVMLVKAGRRVSAFNVDAASVSEAFAWAEENCAEGAFSLAARFELSGGGVSLMWLTPPPEELMAELG
ncbi:hypothetical protein NB037_07935 [Rathayibacter sp. ZW T2_19]|uniref:Uncharacterized protein n=1 Tax=Rathayibacter rubneri TaxID=2950106 RepID=A0A9X2E0M2_9MICO|nr:hypothetical protein [Rathayibacter rubneri]MCM6762346.1 hypothetical protein [Rathayibacter rubneri]